MCFAWRPSPLVTGWLLAAISPFSFLPLQAAASAAQVGRVETNSAPVASAAVPNDAVENSVVKVFSTVRYPDYFRSVDQGVAQRDFRHGVVIEGKRILSNAHVVNYASQVQIQANQAGDKISATVVAIDPGIDLAVLKLDDETFFDTHAPLERAKKLPEIKDAVMVYGYPTGGSSLSITKGIVSRIEFAPYNFPVSGLRIQIDAAINPGNSGGPAVVGDKMIGLAFSRLQNAENIGYIIPCEEIELFLQGVGGGPSRGQTRPCSRISRRLENPALRAFLKLDKSVQGIVRPPPGQPGPRLRAEGMGRHHQNRRHAGGRSRNDHIKSGSLRLHFTYLVQKTARNGTVPLTLIRAGKEMQLWPCRCSPNSRWSWARWKELIPPTSFTGRWSFPPRRRSFSAAWRATKAAVGPGS